MAVSAGWRHSLALMAMEERAVAVSAGHVHSLALTASGAVWSWGRLGHGNQVVPKHIAALKEEVVAVSAGDGSHSLALRARNREWCGVELGEWLN